jgi:hypothetical protein
VSKIIDETGKRYGCLTVMRADIRPLGQDGRNRAYWMCQCDCGNEKSILGDHLRSGAIRTCSDCDSIPPPHGKPRPHRRGRMVHPGGKIRWEVGNRYGILTVIERQKRPAVAQWGRNARWICRCDCGEETVVDGGDLRSRKTMSCGCVRRRRFDEARAAKAREKVLTQA